MQFCTSIHETRGLDAIKSEFSAKQPADAALASRTTENCRIWTKPSTSCDPRHDPSVYVPVQTRARLDAIQERARRSAKPTSTAGDEMRSYLHLQACCCGLRASLSVLPPEQRAVSNQNKQESAPTRGTRRADLEPISLKWWP